MPLIAVNKADAQTKVDEAVEAVSAAKAKGAQDTDFTNYEKIQAAKEKIVTL